MNAWGTIHYEYNAANEMTKAGNCTYTYDANGNRITAASTNESSEYEYNATNRLSQVTRNRGTGVATYSYDALGRRSRKGSGSEYEGYLYDGLSFETAGVYRLESGSEDKYDNLVKDIRTPSVQAPVVDGYNPLWGSHRELEGGATVLEEHQWVQGSILAVRGEGNFQLTYQHHDDQDSVIYTSTALDSRNTVYRYDAFGTPIRGVDLVSNGQNCNRDSLPCCKKALLSCREKGYFFTWHWDRNWNWNWHWDRN